jgi:hypothetical protein
MDNSGLHNTAHTGTGRIGSEELPGEIVGFAIAEGGTIDTAANRAIVLDTEFRAAVGGSYTWLVDLTVV